MLASTPDLLRLVVLPVFAWAAWRDLKTRRLPAGMWYPLLALGLALVGWELFVRHPFGVGDRRFLVQVAISLLFVAPLGLVLARVAAFGGADAKAIATLAVLLPTFPVYRLGGVALPVERTLLGLFALTVVTNAALLGLLYPVALAVRNLLVGDVSPAMFVGRRVPAAELPRTHGWLMETREGLVRRGLDLDALRMYLRWRGTTLAALRRDPDGHRDPYSVGTTGDPTDGAVHRGPATDGGRAVDPVGDDALADPASSPDATATDAATPAPPAVDETNEADEADDPMTGSLARSAESAYDDAWAAEAFLADVPGTAYGTTPATLREGLETVVARDRTWVSIGTPFVVPLFFGLLVAFVYGDLVFGLLGLLGLV